MKKCFKCGIIKSLSQFYRHKQMSDGHFGKCIACAKKDAVDAYKTKSSDIEWKDKERLRGREKYHRLYVGTGKAKPQNNRRYSEKYPEKKRGTILSAHLKPPNIGLEKHHWSYNDEHFKDVIWLTKKQHMKAHRFLVYDQEHKMYRRFDTNELLETKGRHKRFIFYCIKNKQD
jgi:hypothetical protein